MSIRIIGPYKPMGRLHFRIATTLPVFTVDPTITNADLYSDTLFTANPGVYSPAKVVPVYSWKLNGVEISTSKTVTPGAAGTLTLTVTLTNSRGSVTKTLGPLTVAARPPVFTVQPSISPLSATMGTTFTGNKGSATNTATYSYQWLLNGKIIKGQTGLTYVSDGVGSLTFQVTATGPTGIKVVATSAAVTVSASQIVQHAPTWDTQPGLLGTFAEGTGINVQVQASDVENNIASYAVTGGTLPGGLSLDPFSGAIAGTLAEVTADTSYSFEITVTDRTNLTLKGTFKINVSNVKTTVVWDTPNDQPVVDTAPGQPVSMNVGAQSS